MKWLVLVVGLLLFACVQPAGEATPSVQGTRESPSLAASTPSVLPATAQAQPVASALPASVAASPSIELARLTFYSMADTHTITIMANGTGYFEGAERFVFRASSKDVGDLRSLASSSGFYSWDEVYAQTSSITDIPVYELKISDDGKINEVRCEENCPTAFTTIVELISGFLPRSSSEDDYGVIGGGEWERIA